MPLKPDSKHAKGTKDIRTWFSPKKTRSLTTDVLSVEISFGDPSKRAAKRRKTKATEQNEYPTSGAKSTKITPPRLCPSEAKQDTWTRDDQQQENASGKPKAKKELDFSNALSDATMGWTGQPIPKEPPCLDRKVAAKRIPTKHEKMTFVAVSPTKKKTAASIPSRVTPENSQQEELDSDDSPSDLDDQRKPKATAAKRRLINTEGPAQPSLQNQQPPLPQQAIDWEHRRQELMQRFADNKADDKYRQDLEQWISKLENFKLEQLKREQDISSAGAAALSQPNDPVDERDAEDYPSEIHMNPQQRRVAEHPPDRPLSVRAGAGTGKTQTMVKRATTLVSSHGIDPGKILMLTFTKKASGEMRERIAAEFAKQSNNTSMLNLPTVKTFHSLAFRWIRTYWRECGLGRSPNPVTTKDQEKKLMKEVIQCHARSLQLERCYNRFASLLDFDEQQDADMKKSWDNVVSLVKEQKPDAYAKAKALANSDKKKEPKASSKTKVQEKKKKTEKQTAEEKRKQDEQELVTKQELARQCYLELLRIHNSLRNDAAQKDTVSCDIETKWKADTQQCNMYLQLIRNARLGQHSPSEYLPQDASIFRQYEEMQEQTGQIDFDKMLALFSKLLQCNQEIKKSFHKLYDYVIVDEYQDNSEVQSKILLDVVNDGRVTVVGDDDQCIYEFRGANPGNFEAFSRHFAPRVAEETLEDNFRSTGNILHVGSNFLKGSLKRKQKTLRPTKEEGCRVDHWKCQTASEQAECIAKDIKQRHELEGMPWSEIACLFRCFQMGEQEPLNKQLQLELAKSKIPVKISGGKSFLDSEAVRDILAYVNLALTGNPFHTDDEAFSRVLNKPPRRIGEKMMELIKAQKTNMDEKPARNATDGQRHTPAGLEEAAQVLLNEMHLLRDKKKEQLEAFFDLINDLRVEAIRTALPEFLCLVWNKTDLASLHQEKEEKKEGKSGVETPDPPEIVYPEEIRTLICLAEAHVKEWKAYEKSRQSNISDKRQVDSLFNLARKCLIENADQFKLCPQKLPQVCLPDMLYIDDLYTEDGVGLPVINSFMADLQLQTPEDAESEVDDEERVTISTIHRAKGLEWREVYVPFFNEGYLPTNFREKRAAPVRHKPHCSARDGDKRWCTMKCEAHYALLDEKRLGLTLEQRHSNEERRLAHVAATRAKDRLVFVSTQNDNNDKPCQASSLEGCVPSEET